MHCAGCFEFYRDLLAQEGTTLRQRHDEAMKRKEKLLSEYDGVFRFKLKEAGKVCERCQVALLKKLTKEEAKQAADTVDDWNYFMLTV